MFNIVDLMIVAILCGLIIFCLVYLKFSKRVKKNVPENVGDDILQIFYDESVYKIENCGEKVKQSEDLLPELEELGIVSPIDDSPVNDEDGFFSYNDYEDDVDDDEPELPDPPRTWADFMKEDNEGQKQQSPVNLSAHFQGMKKEKDKHQSIKDVVASVREEIVQKPLSDEEFKKKYFSRLYDNNEEGEKE
ncbi:MAG: hypothetical protein LBG17_08085 [Bacteroidales bacterium]|jgi:hypothetical protein|nr:hypothetical protein [Bacteroidales bacterium]